MNKANTLFVLINTLSKSEKRYIQLYSNLQSGDKIYVSLFNLFNKKQSVEEIYTLFCKIQKGSNFEIAVKHLYKIIMECLVKLRENEDTQTKIFNYISKADILFGRELFDAAFDELNKAKKLAITYENDPLILLTRRIELKYLGALGFEGISERQLVNKQMKINEIMKYSRNTNLHLQLYDILKHRLTYKGYARSDKQKEDLNDLVLSELNLIANSSYRGFEAEKLHLLFQATYFLNSGNYKTAIRHYQQLIDLFAENTHLMLNPPIYYLSALQGILDSLQVTGLYHEMPYFIEKLNEIEQNDYPTEFVLLVRFLIYQYQFSGYIQTGKFAEAEQLTARYEENLIKKMSLLSLEGQLKIHLNNAILHLCLNDMNNARKNMKKIFSSGKLFYTLPSFKTARLINLLIQAELRNYDFFENEIASIKRNINYEKHTYRTEKLLFRFVMAYPLPSYHKSRHRLWLQYKKEIDKIKQDKYEKQLLKTFDILSWIESKITERSFAEILIENSIQL